MSKESNLQSKIASYLRRKGCYVIVTTAITGVPNGCPDVIALIDGGGWIALEVKKEYPYRKDGKAKAGAFRPLQLETVKKLNGMYFSRVVWPESWAEIKLELEGII